MTVHGNVELLSSYVDDELEGSLRDEVASHLADCPPCRERIGGLRRVVEELQALETVAPPTGLSSRVRRAVLFEGNRQGGLRAGAEALRRWTNSPLLLPLFGVVTAMAVLLYLFAVWSESAGHPGTRLVVGAPAETAVAPAREGDVRELEGRVFRRVGGRWLERGADPEAVAESIDLRPPAVAPPELEPFRPLGGRVVLLVEGRAVEVVFADAAP